MFWGKGCRPLSLSPVAVRQGLRIEALSLTWMMVEAAVALAVGISAHSLALQAFGVDSVIELVSGGILFWRLGIEAHGASPHHIAIAERRSSLVVGWALLVLAAYVVIMAIIALVTHGGAQPTKLGLAIAGASALIMPYLARRKRTIGTQIGSTALVADGACSMVCAYMSLTVLVGLGLTALFGWWWLNPIAALAVIYFVVREGLEAIH